MPHVQRNSVNVYYESHGQGTPIVFLHPFLVNDRSMTICSANLSDGSKSWPVCRGHLIGRLTRMILPAFVGTIR